MINQKGCVKVSRRTVAVMARMSMFKDDVQRQIEEQQI